MMTCRRLISPLPLLMFMAMLPPFLVCLSEVNHSVLPSTAINDDLMGISSIAFPLTGNIWSYFAPIHIGLPAKLFNLAVDTGSYITWIKCDKSCENCRRPPGASVVPCKNPLCAAIQGDERRCENPGDRCEYILKYGDKSSSHGYLLKAKFHLRLINGTVVGSPLVFGCGYKQLGNFSADGIIGLSMEPIGLVSQIHGKSRIQQTIGHCFRSKGGGTLFIGDDLVPVSGVSWASIIDNYTMDYRTAPVDVLYNGRPTRANGLQFDFDSGAPLTCLDRPSYRAVREQVKTKIISDLQTKPLELSLPEPKLPICWSRSSGRPIRSFSNIRHYFKNLSFSFTQENVELYMPPHAYLLLVNGKVCLGVRDGNKLELEIVNLIGAIAMQDKLVIYDNVNHRIGWTSQKCDLPPVA